MQTRLIDSGQSLATGLADKFIKDDSIRDLTR